MWVKTVAGPIYRPRRRFPARSQAELHQVFLEAFDRLEKAGVDADAESRFDIFGEVIEERRRRRVRPTGFERAPKDGRIGLSETELVRQEQAVEHFENR